MADQGAMKGEALQKARAIWRRRRWLALPAFALPLVAGVVLILSMPSVYESRALVLVDRQQVPEQFVRPTVTSALEVRSVTTPSMDPVVSCARAAATVNAMHSATTARQLLGVGSSGPGVDDELILDSLEELKRRIRVARRWLRAGGRNRDRQASTWRARQRSGCTGRTPPR